MMADGRGREELRDYTLYTCAVQLCAVKLLHQARRGLDGYRAKGVCNR